MRERALLPCRLRPSNRRKQERPLGPCVQLRQSKSSRPLARSGAWIGDRCGVVRPACQRPCAVCRIRFSDHSSFARSGSGEEHVTGVSSGSMGGSGDEEARRTGLPHQGGSHGNLRTPGSDQQLRQTLDSLKSSKSPAVISYGASWCRVCSQILPSFCKFSNEFKSLTFIYADIDECPETTQNIRYTPTFHFYQDGERVDEMLGTGEERLRDRLWLHS